VTWFTQSANETEAQKTHCLPLIAVDIDFPSGHVRLWSGTGVITIGGNAFLGSGELGKVSAPTEGAAMAVEKKTYQLSNVDLALVSEADIDASFGRDVTEYLGFFDTISNTMTIVPEVNWEGRIDAVRRVDGSTGMIEVSAENRLAFLDRVDGLLNTDEHQQAIYPGDLGMNQQAPMQMKQVVWGGERVIIGSYQQDRRHTIWIYKDDGV
jgi:hypothetical protein